MTSRQLAAARLGEAFLNLREALIMEADAQEVVGIQNELDSARIALESAKIDESVFQMNTA